MQNDNEDIERLLRRAAESYPLKTSGGNWESVASRLEKDNRRPTYAVFNDKRFIGLTLLLFIIAISILSYHYYNISNTKHQPKFSNTNDAVASKSLKTNIVNNNPLTDPALISKNKSRNGKSPNYIISSATSKSSTDLYNNSRPAQKSTGLIKYSTLISKSKSRLYSKITSPKITPEVPLNNEENILNTNKINPSHSVTPKPENELIQPTEKQNIPLPELLKVENDTLDQSHNNSAVPSKNKSKNLSNGLYASIIFGPDLSNIKGQAYNRTGLSTGIIIGYNKNKFSLESGITWDKKYYATDGKYFNPKVISGTPQYSKPLNLSGLCYMFEIPVNIGYLIFQNPNNLIKIKTGLSSYFMKNESYDYSYLYYNRIAYGSSNYKNSSNVFFSELNIAINVAHKVSKKSLIGIEPYVKVPVKAIGYGQMNISSIGFHIVYLQKFK